MATKSRRINMQTVSRNDAAANAAAFRDCRDRNLHSQISICGMRRGGVVRRPFSKLQAWLIAVSPNRESLSLSARSSPPLSTHKPAKRRPSQARGREADAFRDSRVLGSALADPRTAIGEKSKVAAKPPPSVPGKLLRGGTASSPLSDPTWAAAASLPVVSELTLVDSPAAGVTRRRLTDHSDGVDRSG